MPYVIPDNPVANQVPQNMTLRQKKSGVNVLRTVQENIDVAGDRHRLSGVLNTPGVYTLMWATRRSFCRRGQSAAECDGKKSRGGVRDPLAGQLVDIEMIRLVAEDGGLAALMIRVRLAHVAHILVCVQNSRRNSNHTAMSTFAE